MNERVNIQYSIDLEKLPDEVTRLLEGAYENLHHIQQECVIDSAPISLETVERIDMIRMQLADIDYVLSDIMNIINGYMAYRSQGPRDVEAPDMVATPAAERQLLQEQIEKFKNQLNQVEGVTSEISSEGS
jgi:hypothetical protein